MFSQCSLCAILPFPNANRFSNMLEEEIVEEYLRYPSLPYHTTVTIENIIILNYDLNFGAEQEKIRYATFVKMLSEEFPELGNGCDEDYFVAPALIVTENGEYRTSESIWDIMCEIMSAYVGGFLPYRTFLDQENEWAKDMINMLWLSQDMNRLLYA